MKRTGHSGWYGKERQNFAEASQAGHVTSLYFSGPVSQSIGISAHLSPLPNSDLLRGLSYPSVAAQRQQ